MLMLAKKYTDEVNPTGWWLSEKFDGVRALWTGNILVSRNGYKIAAPDWFLEGLPKDIHLDGELWLGRGRFQKLAAIVRRDQPVEAEWREVSYRIFDVVNNQPFEARQDVLTSLLLPSQARKVKQISCQGKDHLAQVFSMLTNAGAEGVMLRSPGSSFERRRSPHLLKLKKTDSCEARVIDHLAGKGKNARRLGALLCELANGIRFRVGSGIPERLRDIPPAIGSLVTICFSGTTDAGIPRFPVFNVVRDYE